MGRRTVCQIGHDNSVLVSWVDARFVIPIQKMSYLRHLAYRWFSSQNDTSGSFNARHIITALQNTKHSIFIETVHALSIFLSHSYSFNINMLTERNI